MARGKMGKRKKDPDKEYRSVKSGLASIINEQFRQPLISFISEMSIKASVIAFLASMLFLFKVNRAIDDNDDEFFTGDGEKVVRDCFKGALKQNKDRVNLVPPAFRRIVEEILGAFEWPDNNYFGNAFKYLWEQYYSNVVTNLNTHCESRLRKFFKMRVYQLNDAIRRGVLDMPWFNASDISNAVKWAYHRKDHTDGDPIAYQKVIYLLQELHTVGYTGNDCDIRTFTAENWFQSLRMWMLIQREIDFFHLQFDALNRQWSRHRKSPQTEPQPDLPQPPKISSFTCIPICSFQRRHIRIDTDVLYNILCGSKQVPQRVGHTNKKGKTNMRYCTQDEFREDETTNWCMFFDIEQIDRQVRYKKEFGFQIMSDGVSVSIQYSQPKTEVITVTSDEEVQRMWLAGEFTYELGIDPGMRTWNASVRLNLITGEECNIKKSSKEYHYDAKQGARDDKAERITRLFTFEEQTDRENVAKRIGRIPSPRNTTWEEYIKHRLRMSKNGFETYTQRSYARLQLDKHIESHRAIDRIAGKLVNHKSALIHIGAGQIAANSPIRIKKHVRCPGTRKLINAFKKRGNCIIRMVDEYMTSQHCGRCFSRFPQWTRSKRYKTCNNCVPDERVGLPELIVTNMSKRMLQLNRTILKELIRMRDQLHEDFRAIVDLLTQRNAARLVSKKQRFWKTWQPNAVNAGPEDAAQAQRKKVLKTVWHRDISAAKLILYRGHCQLFGWPVHPALVRPRRDQNYLAPP